MHFLLRCISILSLFLQVIAEPKSTSHHDAAVYGGKHGLNTHSLSAQQLLNKGIAALGGRAKLEALHGVSSHAYLYRSTSLVESSVPGIPDIFIATSGNQTISYDLSGHADNIVQRIDRQYEIGDILLFANPDLKGYDVSLVTRSGKDGYSCYIAGNEYTFLPQNVPSGYTDAAYANILQRDAMRLSPKLLLAFKVDPAQVASTLTVRGNHYPVLTDHELNITVAFRPDTFLPYVVRSYEDHKIFGKSANDFVIYNYTAVAGVQFPRRIKIMYNEDELLLDTLIDDIKVNPSFPAKFFDGIPESQIKNTAFALPSTPAAPSVEYGEAEVFELSQNLLWSGGYLGKLDNVEVTYPVPELPGLIHLVFRDAPGYTTTIVNVENAVMVTDAPPHQSKLVIEWVHKNLKKKVTHLLLSHHHHDHSYGAADYVAEGAKLVIPHEFTYYYNAIPGVQFAPVTATEPFIHRSKTMQVRGVWPGIKDVHSSDWMYFTFTPRCPTARSPFTVSIADAWSPGLVGYKFGQAEAIAYLTIARKAKIPRNNLVIPLHGVPSNATDLYALTGYDYPNYNILDFVPGGPWC